MAWTVRTKDGALEFEDFQRLQWAFEHGLIGPDDEIRDPGKEEWKKASAHPHLRGARPVRQAGGAQRLGAWLAVAFGVLALALMARGYWVAALVVGMGLAFYLLRLNRAVLRPKVGVRP